MHSAIAKKASETKLSMPGIVRNESCIQKQRSLHRCLILIIFACYCLLQVFDLCQICLTAAAAIISKKKL